MSLRESMYAVLFDAIQEGLFVVNTTGTIVLSNSVCESLFGYSEKELIGQKIELLIPSASREKHKGLREKYHKNPLKRSMGAAMRLSGQHKNGQEIPVQVSLNPFEEGGEKYVAALVSDVTMRRKAEDELIHLAQTLEEKVVQRTRELKESEQLYRSIARNFPGGVISIFDRSYHYLFAEGQDLFELGIETEDLIGQNYLNRLSPELKSEVKQKLDQVFEGHAKNFEVKLGQLTYLLNAVPLFDENNLISRILVVEKNITSQKEVADRLEENLKIERELNEMKSRFVSMASHEFRTPLTTINSSAGLVLKYNERKLSDKIPKHIERIRVSVRNLTNILNDFLSLEKLESGNIQLKLQETDLVPLFKEVVEEIDGLIKNGQYIDLDLPDSLPFVTDLHLLKNILINLSSNALKYSPENSKVIIRTIEKSDRLIIEVIDFGIGIPKEDQANMFERFFRAGNVINIEGTGLGLNIVTKYLDLIKGCMSFESEENKGTKFIVELPKLNVNV